jgi:superfamily I DNA and/or RNA helicase
LAAQFLPPGSVDFDLLIIDEASELRPEDALGLVARCRRIVVVGDKKQLPPPTSFVRMLAADGDRGSAGETAIQNGEGVAPITGPASILSLCETRGFESRMLRWRYPIAAAVPGNSLQRGILSSSVAPESGNPAG